MDKQLTEIPKVSETDAEVLSLFLKLQIEYPDGRWPELLSPIPRTDWEDVLTKDLIRLTKAEAAYTNQQSGRDLHTIQVSARGEVDYTFETPIKPNDPQINNLMTTPEFVSVSFTNGDLIKIPKKS